MSARFGYRAAVMGAVLAFLAAGCGGGNNGVEVRVTPGSAEMVPLTGLQFEATVRGTLDRRVEWSIVTLEGYPLDLAGQVTVAGGYTAPKTIPPETLNLIKVRATSVVDPTKFAEATVRVVPVPLDPASGPSSGGTTIHITGKDFSPNNVPEVFFGGEPATEVTVASEVLLIAKTPEHVMDDVDVTIQVPGEQPTVYPEAFRFSAGNFQFSGGTLLRPCGYYSGQVTAVDLDGCGGPDLLVNCNYEYELATVLQNNGTWEKPQHFSPGGYYYIYDMDIADLNSDGYPDIVTHLYDRVAVWMNGGNANGCGTWQGFQNYGDTPLSTYGWGEVAVGDVTGDGNADYVFGGYNSVNVMPGNGDGTFDDAATISMPAAYYPFYGMQIGDVDGDNNNDIVVAFAYLNQTYGQDGVHLFRSNGDGTFQPRVDILASTSGSTYTWPRGMTLADTDNDGQDEIFYPMSADVSLAEFGWDGVGALQMEQAFPTMFYANYGILSRDLNNDGRKDIVYNSYYDGQNSLYTQNLVVHWSDPVNDVVMPTQRSYSVPIYANYFEMADLDGDALPEMIASGNWDSSFIVVQQGNFEPDPYDLAFGPEFVDIGAAPVQLSTIRLGANQRAGIMAALDNGGGVALLDMSGDAQDQPLLTRGVYPTSLGVTVAKSYKLDMVSQPASSITRTLAVNMDNDGFEDLLAIEGGDYITATPGKFWLATGAYNGFNQPQAITPEMVSQVGAQITDGTVADLDGDGWQDLVFGMKYGPEENPLGGMAVIWGGPPAKARNDNNAPDQHNLWFLNPVSMPLPAAFAPARIDSADLDGDGDLDLVAVDRDGNRVVVYENTLFPLSEGKVREELFVDQYPFYVGDAPRDLIMTDVDNDGFIDLVALAELAIDYNIWTEIDVLRNRGTLVFGHPQTGEPERYRVPGDPYEFHYADLDQDGLGDLVVASVNPSSLVILRSAGEGRFLDAEVFVAGKSPRGVGIMDFDHDNRLDLAVGDYSSNAIRFLTNLSK